MARKATPKRKTAQKKKANKTDNTASKISDEEMQESLSGPALHVNKMYATSLAQGIRLTFSEGAGERFPARFRTAVFLSYPDAVALRELLTRQLKDFEAAQAIEIEIGPDGTPVIKPKDQ